MRSSFLPVALLVAVLITGCTVARKMSFDTVKTKEQVLVAGQPSLISVVDQREEVLAGKRKPTWSGSLLSTVQIAYPVNTSTGKPLADEFAQVLRNSLDPAGNQTTLQAGNPFKDTVAFFNSLKGKPVSRVIILSVNRWNPSSMPRLIDIKYECNYDLLLQVFDTNGKLIGEASEKDHWETIEMDLAGTISKLQRLAADLLETRMTRLLGNQQIRSALQ